MTRARLIQFLTQRLSEELGRLWGRELTRSEACGGPSLASQLDVIDDLLRTLAGGRLPGRNDLVILLSAYRKHADYDPAWSALA